LFYHEINIKIFINLLIKVKLTFQDLKTLL